MPKVRWTMHLAGMLVVAGLLSCAQEQGRDDPLDADGENWSPPSVTAHRDTVVSFATTTLVTVAVVATDTNVGGRVEKYYWDIGADGWDDSTDAASYVVTSTSGGPVTVRWAARDDDGVMTSDTFVVIFNRPPSAPNVTAPTANTAWQSFSYQTGKGTLPLSLSASDPDGASDILTYTLFTGPSADSLTQAYTGRATEYNAATIDSNATVYWRLEVHDLYGDSAVATGTCVAPPPPPPVAPVLQDVIAGDRSATMSWVPVTDASSYNLYYSAGSTVTKTSGTKLSGVTSPKQVAGLTNGTQYAFALSAENEAGESGLSGVMTATPAAVDIDGNAYHTVIIGTQEWMAENLKTTKYNDSSSIPLVTDGTAWSNLTTPGYCWYNNDAAANKATYGALYNWHAVNTGKLAPAGWHVPTDAEWTTLTTYLGGESVAGGKLKEAGTAHWWASPNSGATNESGFTALPGGYRTTDGAFYSLGINGYWWSATAYVATDSWHRCMYYSSANVFRYNYDVKCGFSVRCVRD